MAIEAAELRNVVPLPSRAEANIVPDYVVRFSDVFVEEIDILKQHMPIQRSGIKRDRETGAFIHSSVYEASGFLKMVITSGKPDVNLEIKIYNPSDFDGSAQVLFRVLKDQNFEMHTEFDRDNQVIIESRDLKDSTHLREFLSNSTVEGTFDLLGAVRMLDHLYTSLE